MAQLHFGTGDSVGFGTTGSATAGTASFNPADISNLQVGDLLVAYIHSQSTSSGTITPPTGWVQYGAPAGAPNFGATRLAELFYYPITSQAVLNALPSTLTWTFSTSAGRVACVVARATGIDLDNIEDSEATTLTQGAGGTDSVSIGSITTVNATTLLVGAVYRQSSAGSSPSLSSFMTAFGEYKTDATGAGISSTGTALGYIDRVSAGATGTVTATWAASVAAMGGFLVAFRAGSWSPPVPTVKYTSAPDTLSDGDVYYTSATDTLTAASEVRSFPQGYASVSAMLAASPFYIAHRGGSANWPEMSLHAYTQAGFWGVGALEFSIARTSDGVWFGLHDETLDRTSGTSGFVASEHTWAEVQAYQITAAYTDDTGQPTRPYMRWEDLMDAYYSTHVIFIDPKHALSHITELLDMMDALPGTPTDHLVAKYFGLTNAWPTAAKARGYTTWGYFYEADVGSLPTYQANWDILGMDYQANGAAWAAALSYGKPVIGFLIADSTAATTAITNGADGLMVSGVTQVIPRTT